MPESSMDKAARESQARDRGRAPSAPSTESATNRSSSAALVAKEGGVSNAAGVTGASGLAGEHGGGSAGNTSGSVRGATSSRSPRRASGMSPEMWVQIVLCVVVAGLLLVVAAVPRMRSVPSAYPREARGSVLETLDLLHAAIRAYRADHGAWPLARSEAGCGDACGEEFCVELTTSTLVDGSVPNSATASSSRAHDGARFGPYVESLDLVNPCNGLMGVEVLGPQESWPALPDETSGWIYRPATGELRANLAGIDAHSGRPYYEL